MLRLSKQAWVHLGIFLLVTVALTWPVAGDGVHTHPVRKNFKDGVPESAAEVTDLLEKLATASSRFAPFKRPPKKNVPPIAPYHPLNPLTAAEIRTAALVIQSTYQSTNLQFKCISLHEPEKAALVHHFLNDTIPNRGIIDRKVGVLVVEVESQAPAWVVVNLRTLKVESWTDGEDHQAAASITGEDLDTARAVTLSNAEVVSRIRKLGFKDISGIATDVLEAGYVSDDPKYVGVRKLVQVFLYAYLGEGDNYYAHPFDFVVYVDLGAHVVRGIEDLAIQREFSTANRTGASVPLAPANYFPDTLTPPSSIREDILPISISRPKGVSFQVQDRVVTWHNFKFHVGYSPREGLLINHVMYNDHGKMRPLFYRISLSEAFIYFGDPRPVYHRKSSYDLGNFEFGTSALSLTPEFCRGHAYYFDSIVHNERAETSLVKNSTCIFEEDAGLLWAHYDGASDRTAVTRSQRLSVSSFINVGSCDYFLSWRFYQDATVELSIFVTGSQNTNLMAIDVKPPPFGNLMAPQVYTQNYQYLFGARIDADIDGVDNTVGVDDIVSVHPSRNPYGNGIKVQSQTFKRVQDAPSDIEPGRTWRISNPNRPPNPVTGKQPAWKLMPQGPNIPNLLTSSSPLRRERVSFADHNMWVLPFDDNQIFINGLYLDGGVSKWTNESALDSIQNKDVVLWHVFGFAFAPDPEDWPVLSAVPDTVGFKLRPSNFFTQNPSVSTPPASQTTAFDDSRKGWVAPPK